MDDYALVAPEMLHEQLQREYWKSQGAPPEVGNDASSRLKNVLLNCTHEEDKRVEITEYQAMRECLWVLVGAYEGFLFRSVTDSKVLEKNRCVPTQAASLSHLSLRAFDSFLFDIAQYATDGLQIRVFLDYLIVSEAATEQAFPPSFRLLADLLSNLLSDFQTAVATLERELRQGELRTLMCLLLGLKPWPLRLHLVARLLLQTVPSQLTTLHYDSSATLFLNTVDEVSCSRICCLGDVYLENLFSNLFVQSLNHFLLPIFSLGVGQRFSEGSHLMPILRICSTDCRSVEFWRRESSPTDPDLRSVLPKALWPVSWELFICLKSICFLHQIGSSFVNTSLLEKMHSFNIPTLPSLSISADELLCPPERQCILETPLISLMDLEMRYLLNNCISSSSSPQMPKPYHCRRFNDSNPAAFFYKKQIQHHIRAHKHQVSYLLVNLLLVGSPDPMRPYLNLSCLINLLGNVCLFASGDCMDDFCRGLFRLSPLLKSSHEVDELFFSSFQPAAMPSTSLENDGCDSWIALLPLVHFSIVQVKDATPSCNSFLDKFNRISLGLDIPWPLSVVVQSEQIGVYAGVFKFILMIKWALWVLVHRCHFARSDTPLSAVFHHRALMVRMRMLFVANGLHAFVLNHVEAARNAFLREWHLTDSADCGHLDGDFSALLSSHASFVQKLSELCLLTESSLLLRKAVLGLLEIISGLEGIFCAHKDTVELLNLNLNRLIEDFSTHVTLLNSMITRTMHTNQSVSLMPLQTVFSEASFFNTNVETRLHK
uniref:Gamma-tubulin complex component n=1 Tax=Schistocephalus solidus TaxID=70667 RepID=A0A0X3NPI0_SCHSO